VLDLRYEARCVDQNITLKTKSMSISRSIPEASPKLPRPRSTAMGTMQALLSSGDRLKKVVFDILDDFYTKPRLASGRGNAMLVASSIYEACQYFEIFQSQALPNARWSPRMNGCLKYRDREYAIYQKMLEDYKKVYGAILGHRMKQKPRI